MAVKVLVLRAAGTNCDRETGHAWRLVGAGVESLHLGRLIERPAVLSEYQILTIPGGFSYGDDVAAGRIFATLLRRTLHDQMRAFIEADRLVLGICNGFQILVDAGLLPYPAVTPVGDRTAAVCTVTENEPPGFQARWVRLRAGRSPCVFLEPGRAYELPIAHGEGRVLFDGRAELARVRRDGLNALSYVAGENAAAADTPPADKPYNPNGSDADIAGLCDPSGRVFGLMPHPERFVTPTQHPCWTSRPSRDAADGLAIFERAVRYFR